MANYNSKWSGPEIDEFLGYAEKAVCYESQELTAEQKAQARSNIGAANYETQERVMSAATTMRTVTLAPSAVAAYIAALPRLLTEIITIKITAGTVAETLNFTGFYGHGRFVLQPDSGSPDVTLAGGVAAYRCFVEVNLQKMTITGGDAAMKAAIYSSGGGFMQLDTCALTAGDGITRGISAGAGSKIYATGCSLTGFSIAAIVSHTSIVSLYDVAASDNTTGAQVWAGGIILLGGSTPETVGGSANAKVGGMIVKKDGTLL